MRLLAAFLVLALMSCPAYAGEKEDETYASFEWFCLSHLQNPSSVTDVLSVFNAKPIPQDKLDKIAQSKGRGWFIEGKSLSFAVLLSDDGACTIFAEDVDGNAVEDLLVKTSANAKLAEEPMGSQKQGIYAVTALDGKTYEPAHGVVIATTSQLESVKNVILSSIPEALMQQKGISIPKTWPAIKK